MSSDKRHIRGDGIIYGKLSKGEKYLGLLIKSLYKRGGGLFCSKFNFHNRLLLANKSPLNTKIEDQSLF